MFGAGQQQRSTAELDEDRRLGRRLNDEASSSRQTTRVGGRHSSASQQQQVQFHSFNENDDDDDEDEQRDPYNSKPNYRQYYYNSSGPEDRNDDDDEKDDDHQRRYQHDEPGQVPAATAYDSMSTILEVDSEEANSSIGQSPEPASLASERARELESPIEVRTTPTRRQHQANEVQASEDFQKTQRYDAGSPVGRISPEDKFGGALSALAAQMERLQRSVATTPSDVGGDRNKGANKQTSQISAGGRSKWQIAEKSLEQSESGKQLPDGRRSADSLMMISISPVGAATSALGSPISPLINTLNPLKSSTGRFQHRPEVELVEERKVVEVSNRSTMTSINLQLMDKLLAKYYVEQQDKACQSIKFDCDLEDEFDIVEQQDGSSSLSRRSKGSSPRFANNPNKQQQTSNVETMAKPQMKSVAIGTEKFARERFSLLPQTKTRSTQTGPNLNDSDHGTSETRRFKLSSHLSGLSSLMRSSSSPANSSLTLADEEQAKVAYEKLGSADESGASVRKVSSPDHRGELKERTSFRQEASPSAASTSDESVSTQTDDQQRDEPRKISTKSSDEQETKVASAKQEQAQSDNVANLAGRISKEPSPSEAPPPEAQPPKPAAAEPKKVPSLKTELRVIIEFADSRRKQRNELKSNAQLVDGKLSKRTEVSTSKQVAVSPRQVRDELELAGQRHSILLNPRHKRQREEWHEISKSSVCNELETNTRESRRRSRDVNSNEPETGASETDGSKQQISDIVMSSEATIRQLSSDQSAIELRSRAAQRYASKWPAAADGERAPEGERLLVESAAAFDESQPFDTEVDGAEVGQVKLSQMEPAGERDGIRRTTAGARLSPQAAAEPAARLAPDPKVASSSPVSVERPAQRVEASGSQATLMKVDEGRQPMPSGNERPRVSERPQSPRYLSSPNLSEQQHRNQQQRAPVRSTSRFEFDERSEDRRQVTRNGRLVYDDRLREHHRYETRPAASVNGEQNVASESRQGREQPHEQTTKSTLESANKTDVRNNDLQAGQNKQWRSRSQFNLASGQATSKADYNKQRALNERWHQLEKGTIATQTATNNGQSTSERLPTGFSSPQINGRTSSSAGQAGELVRFNSGSNLAGGHVQQTPTRSHPSPAPNRQAQLLKPIRLQTGEVGSTSPPPQPLVSPPNLFADHTSNLSHSDPETMDSGFVQSGAGSSNNINQLQHQLRPTSRLARAQRTGRAGPQLAEMSELDVEKPANGHESLTFVDADEEREDELLEQLAAGIGTGQRQRLASGGRVQRGVGRNLFDGDQTNNSTTTKTLHQPTNGRAPHPADRSRLAGATLPTDSDMVTPLPTFKLNQVGGAGEQTRPTLTKTTTDSDQTELTTRLTRCKFNENRTAPDDQKRRRRRTLTKLDQNLVAPNFECLLRERQRSLGDSQARGLAQADGSKNQRRRLFEACRFKAQVVFESDTDSAAERLSATGGRRSAASSLAANSRRRSGPQSSTPNVGQDQAKATEKQLITETKYSLTNGLDGKQESGNNQTLWRAGSSDAQQLTAQKRPPLLQPNWDYSLRVNRMRGNKVDSRVSTHIKHSRQPAPNRTQTS